MPLLNKKPFVPSAPPADLNPNEEVFVCKATNEAFRDYETQALVVAASVTDHVYAADGDAPAAAVLSDGDGDVDGAVTSLDLSPSKTDPYKYYPAVVGPSPALYIYELEYGSAFEAQMMPTLLPGRFLSRKKSIFTREKTKAFLKLCLSKEESTEKMPWFVRSHLVVKYRLDSLPLHGYYMLINPSAYPPEPIQPGGSAQPASLSRPKKRRTSSARAKSGQLIPGFKRLIPGSSEEVSETSASAGHFPSSGSKRKSGTPRAMQRTMQVLRKLGESSISVKERRALWEKELARRKVEREAEKAQKKQEQEMLKAKRDKERLKRREERRKEIELGRHVIKEKGKRYRDSKKDAETEKLRRKQVKEKEKEMARLEKEAAREARLDWLRPRDDLECEDHKLLPKPSPVQTRLLMRHFGDALMLLQFIHSFQEFLELDKHFEDGISLALIEDALSSSTLRSPLCRLLKMFLAAIFRLLEAEEEFKPFDLMGMNRSGSTGISSTHLKTPTDNDLDTLEPSIFNASAEEETEINPQDDDSSRPANSSTPPSPTQKYPDDDTDEIIAPSDYDLRQTARDAFMWPLRYQGTLLNEIEVSPSTITEIIRLHLASAGGRAYGSVASFRHTRRGGFTDWDDPACELKCCSPGLVKRLEIASVFELDVGERVELLQVLANQMLTFAAVRDFMENGANLHKKTKRELKELGQALEKARKELLAKEKVLKRKTKKKKKPPPPSPAPQAGEPVEGEKEKRRGERKRKKIFSLEAKKAKNEVDDYKEEVEAKALVVLRAEYEKMVAKKAELIERLEAEKSVRRLTPLGMDRAYQTYWTFTGLPGVFVEKADGNCWPLLAVPFVLYADSVLDDADWAVYEELESVDALARALNGRGYRERALKEQLRAQRSWIAMGFEKSAVAKAEKEADHTAAPEAVEKNESDSQVEMEREAETQSEISAEVSQLKVTDSKNDEIPLSKVTESKDDEIPLSEVAESKDDKILLSEVAESKDDRIPLSEATESKDDVFPLSETEESKDDIIPLSEMAESKDDTIPLSEVTDRAKMEETSKSSSETASESAIPISAERELIEELRVRILDMEDKIWNGNLGAVSCPDRTVWRDRIAAARGDVRDVIQAFTSAILDLEAGIDRRFVTKPLGADTAFRKSGLALKDARNSRWLLKNLKQQLESGCLARWRSSLVARAPTGLSQLGVYLSTLNRSILWCKSALNASCRLCRRKGDAHLMLLCDGCDRGHHTYCLDPPMDKVPDGDWFCGDCRGQRRPSRKWRRQPTGDRERRRRGLKRSSSPIVAASKKGRNEGMDSEYVYGEVVSESATRRKSADARGSDVDEQLRKCEELWKELKNHEESWPFLEPVNKKANPDYYEIIKHPVDLQSIRHKLNMREYASPREFSTDVRLMFRNCAEYNKPRSSVYRAGHKLGRFFEKRLGQIGFGGPTGHHETRRSTQAAESETEPNANRSDE